MTVILLLVVASAMFCAGWITHGLMNEDRAERRSQREDDALAQLRHRRR